MNRIQKNRKGFTLVELLVVVLILAILMAVALPLYLGAIKNSERGAARANMQTIANANQSFRLKTGAYATAISDLVEDLGSTTISGPGTPARSYEFLAAGATCDPDGDGPLPDSTAVPAGAYGVKSSVATDGCFIPGISTR